MNIRLSLVTLSLIVAAPAVAQDTIAADSPEGQKIIAEARYAAGDCLAGPEGSIVPNAKDEAVACDSEKANWRVEVVTIDPFTCPEGTARLMQIGPNNATFCLTKNE